MMPVGKRSCWAEESLSRYQKFARIYRIDLHHVVYHLGAPLEELIRSACAPSTSLRSVFRRPFTRSG